MSFCYPTYSGYPTYLLLLFTPHDPAGTSISRLESYLPELLARIERQRKGLVPALIVGTLLLLILTAAVFRAALRCGNEYFVPTPHSMYIYSMFSLLCLYTVSSFNCIRWSPYSSLQLCIVTSSLEDISYFFSTQRS